MDRFEEMLNQLRDPRECSRLVKGATGKELAYIAQKAAAILAALPAAHAELGSMDRGALPAVVEVVRLLGILETVLLGVAYNNGRFHGHSARDPRHHDPAEPARVSGLGRLALL